MFLLRFVLAALADDITTIKVVLPPLSESGASLQKGCKKHKQLIVEAFLVKMVRDRLDCVKLYDTLRP